MVRLTFTHPETRSATLVLVLLFCVGCATTAPEYDVPVVEGGVEETKSEQAEQSDVIEPQAPVTSDATIALLAASSEASRAGEHRLAISHIERAIRIEPKNAELWVHLSRAYLSDGRPKQARQYARKALALAGERYDLQRNAWLALADVEDYEGNLVEARRIRRRFPAGRG